MTFLLKNKHQFPNENSEQRADFHRLLNLKFVLSIQIPDSPRVFGQDN